MNKPTIDEIKDLAKSYGLLKVNKSESIESFTLVIRYKKDAIVVCKSINDKFGQWVYAMVHDEWKNPHVSVGYRSEELSKCPFCGWLDDRHFQYCHRPLSKILDETD